MIDLIHFFFIGMIVFLGVITIVLLIATIIYNIVDYTRTHKV